MLALYQTGLFVVWVYLTLKNIKVLRAETVSIQKWSLFTLTALLNTLLATYFLTSHVDMNAKNMIGILLANFAIPYLIANGIMQFLPKMPSKKCIQVSTLLASKIEHIGLEHNRFLLCNIDIKRISEREGATITVTENTNISTKIPCMVIYLEMRDDKIFACAWNRDQPHNQQKTLNQIEGSWVEIEQFDLESELKRALCI